MPPQKYLTWKSLSPEAPDSGCGLISSFKAFPAFPSLPFFHYLRVHELKRSKQSNISTAQNILGWPVLNMTQGFRGKKQPKDLFLWYRDVTEAKTQNKPAHNASANNCLVDTTQLNFNPENCLLFWLLWGAQICTLQQLVVPAISCASKKQSPSLRPGPRCQNSAVHLESLKSLNVESLTVIMSKHINASLGCHNHMKGRLKHVGESARSSRTKVWRFWLHIFIMHIIILIENVSLWPIFFLPVTLVHIHGTW